MKKLMVAMMALILFPAVAGASTYTFNAPIGLYSLDHYRAYSWGIEWNLPSNEVITEATLTFDQIYNWKVETNILYIDLLDNPEPGTKKFFDNQGVDDYFSGQGVPIGNYKDLDGPGTKPDLTYTFSSLGLIDDLNLYIKNDGIFGFGFDPDCHFYNKGITFEVTTAPVPEPATLLLLGSGLLGLVGVRRRGKRANG